MTEDFKTKLLEYFTGNFQEGTTPYTYYQSDIETNINNLYQTLSSEIGNQYTGEFEITGALNAKTPSGEINIHILYGTAQGSTLHTYDFGFIVLIDNEFNVLDILTEYTSGVVIGQLNVLNIDEEGYLYGIETNYNSTQKRFIMLNNVALKLINENYYVKIRRTYNLPNEINGNNYSLITKKAEEAKYVMAGTVNVGGVATPTATELEIIVGASNNWTNYYYNDTYTLTSAVLLDLYIRYTSDNLYFQILGRDANYICKFWLNGTSINVNRFSISGNIYSLKAKFDLYQDAICGIITTDYSNYMNYEIISIEGGGNTEIIYQETGEYFGTTSASDIEIITNGLNVYYIVSFQQSESDYNFEVGRIVVKSQGYDLIKTFNQVASSGARYHYNYLFVSQESNLFTWYLQIENTCYKVIQSFNLNDYKNGAVDNTKYFVPKSANLYNGTNLILSKELYNLTVNDNITTATVEIPNMKLNSDTINGENLIGSTYENIVEAEVEFTKNQYETVDVNFINTLGIQNKNNETIQEVEGQNRLNDSISKTTDYEDARMTKYRINYADETNEVNSNIWYPIANYFTTDLTITVSKEISNIDFISEDEQTTYTTIYPVLEVGKTYKISQDVFLKEKGSPQPVYYNTDEVYYGNDEVYY